MKRTLPIFLWLAVASATYAAPTTLQFTGINNNGPLAFTLIPYSSNVAATIPANAPYTATVTYDDAQVVTPLAFQGGTRSTYQFTDITLTMGGSTVTLNGPGSIDIVDNNTFWSPTNTIGVGDVIAINSGAIPVPGPPVGSLYGGAYFNNIAILFIDSTGTAFSGTAMPKVINPASYATSKALELSYASSAGWTISTLPVLTAISSTATTPTITTASLPNGVYGMPYSSTVTATAPNADATTISIDPATLPSGLSFNGTAITGTPSTVGISSVAITATDAVTKLSASTHLPLTINDAAISFSPSISNALASSAYSATLSGATGGTGKFTYTSSGLPSGLSLSGLTISGPAPATAGAYPFTVTATDSAGTPSTANLVLNVSAAVPVACSGSNVVESAYVTHNPGFITVNGGLNLLDHLWTTNLNAQNTSFLGGVEQLV